MNRKNRKGFTLIEMLAVIVVLAILILLASSNVVPMVTNARKNALAIEGNEMIDSAKNAYQMVILNGDLTTGSACFSLEYLYQEGFFEKGHENGYRGSVLVSPDEAGKVINYSFWIDNNSFVVAGESGTTGKNATNVSQTNHASENCENKANKLFSK